jgi:hypothetical protein
MGQLFSDDTELSYEIIQKLTTPRNVNTDKTKLLFIFDYDDTFLPTNHFFRTNFNLSSREFVILQAISQKVKLLLTYCLSQGIVYVISNANKSWLIQTSVRFLQLPLNLLKKINIITSQDLYKELPNDKRKEQAFNELNNEFIKAKKVINIGDSTDEFLCAQRIRLRYKHLSLINIKFQYEPSLIALDKELRYLIEHIEEFINTNDNLNIDMNSGLF